MQRIVAELRVLHFKPVLSYGVAIPTNKIDYRNGHYTVTFTEDGRYLYATQSMLSYQLAIAKAGGDCYVMSGYSALGDCAGFGNYAGFVSYAAPNYKVPPAYGTELFLRKLREIYE